MLSSALSLAVAARLVLLLLPLGAFVLFASRIAAWQESQGRTPSARECFLGASVLWGLAVVVITELLSLYRLLDVVGVAGGWVAAGALAMAIPPRGRLGNPVRWRGEMDGSTRLQLAGLAAVLGAVGLIALVAAPTNWDSMVYHLSRVEHWVQNRTVAFYPTSVLHQLSFAPWAEYAILHLRVLSGGDGAANLVQWFSFLGVVVGASLLARDLGAPARTQLLAAVVAATIPMAILEGSSTQNDLVVSFWLVCTTYYGLRLAKRPGLATALALGASLGLAVLTKATAYIFGLPIVILVAVLAVRRHGRAAWRMAPAAALLALAINAPHYARNVRLFGDPLGPRVEHQESGAGEGTSSVVANQHANTRLDGPVLISSLTRNVALHLGGPSAGQAGAVERAVQSLHRRLGLDPSDPATTWEYQEFHVPTLNFNENQAGNPIHLVLVLVAAGMLWLRPRRWNAATLGLSAATVAGFLLFCAYLKWQPWHSRLHLSLFLLWAPLIAVALGGRLGRRGQGALAVALLLAAAPWVLRNDSRPLLTRNLYLFSAPRDEQYFDRRPYMHEQYLQAAAAIHARGCTRIGLDLRVDDWSYPLWPLLRRAGATDLRIEHVNVRNVSARTALASERTEFRPCAIFSVIPDPTLDPGEAALNRTGERVSVSFPTPGTDREGPARPSTRAASQAASTGG